MLMRHHSIRSAGRARATRRGVAMLLVIIALTLATTLSAAYLASRDNSAVIGANVASAAASRWASMSGIDYGITILQTESDWRTDHVAGKIVDDLAVGDSSLDIDLVDMVTSGSPTADTEYVRLISTAETDGVRSVTTAEAYVPVEYGDSVTVDLSDFAVFAVSTFNAGDDAIVARWSTAPVSDLTPRIAIGTRSTSASAVTLANDATLVDASIYHGPGASEFLVSLSNDTVIQEVELLDQVPLPSPPTVPVSTTPSAVSAYAPASGGTIAANSRYTSATINIPGQAVTLQGNIVFVSESTLILEANSGLLINGDVTLVVFDDLTLQDGSYIELTPGSNLDLYVRGDLSMTNGYIGDERADHTVRDTTGTASYMDPSAIQVIGDTTADSWTLAQTSLLKGSVYTPAASYSVQGASAIYGRVAAATLSLSGTSAIFYDPALDGGNGYTTSTSPIYAADGTMRASYLSLATLDSADLATLSDAQNVKVKSNGKSVGSVSADAVMPPEGEPTPRPVPVEWSLVSTGADASEWEDKGEQYTAPTDPLETDSRTLANTISTTPLAQFLGLSAAIQTSKRTELVNALNAAADAIDDVQYATALNYLNIVIDRTDGLAAIADYMIAGGTRTAILNEAKRIKTELAAR
jgi:hypothetical protein